MRRIEIDAVGRSEMYSAVLSRDTIAPRADIVRWHENGNPEMNESSFLWTKAWGHEDAKSLNIARGMWSSGFQVETGRDTFEVRITPLLDEESRANLVRLTKAIPDDKLADVSRVFLLGWPVCRVDEEGTVRLEYSDKAIEATDMPTEGYDVEETEEGKPRVWGVLTDAGLVTHVECDTRLSELGFVGVDDLYGVGVGVSIREGDTASLFRNIISECPETEQQRRDIEQQLRAQVNPYCGSMSGKRYRLYI